MRPPRWMKLDYVGVTEKGNAGYRLHVAWWYVPVLFVRALFTPRYPVADSCDGLEVTEVRFGR
jgi:hypothetical protein